jgi:mannose-6-phosphate isomerase-like protein (cupin superfamily)
MNDDIRIAAHELRGKSASKEYVAVFQRAEVSIEYYAPREVDKQTPHERDEIYIVISGDGMFVRGQGERTPFRAGDLLFVAAHVPHRFEIFTKDFATWKILYGPYAPA